MRRRAAAPTPRRCAVAVLASAIAGGAVVVACSTFEEAAGGAPAATGDALDAGDAGAGETSDEPESDGASPEASGLVVTPGTFACFESACDLTQNHCCYADNGGPVCKTTCSFGVDTHDFGCDDRADCAGQRCCITVGAFFNLTGTACKTKCDPDYELCATDEDCPKGKTCVPKECRGRLIGTCGDFDVSSFCGADAGADVG